MVRMQLTTMTLRVRYKLPCSKRYLSANMLHTQLSAMVKKSFTTLRIFIFSVCCAQRSRLNRTHIQSCAEQRQSRLAHYQSGQKCTCALCPEPFLCRTLIDKGQNSCKFLNEKLVVLTQWEACGTECEKMNRLFEASDNCIWFTSGRDVFDVNAARYCWWIKYWPWARRAGWWRVVGSVTRCAMRVLPSVCSGVKFDVVS